jgi:hypothetical protein
MTYDSCPCTHRNSLEALKMEDTRKTFWLGIGLLIVIALVAYIPVLQAEFVFDDGDYVVDNELLKSAKGLGKIWFELNSSPQYYPLVFTSYWLEYRLWGLNSLGYHLVNVLGKEMVGESQAFIEDEIAIKLEDYKKSLKKHGIKTILGTIQETLDGKYLAGVSALTGGFTLSGHPTLGILAGTGLVFGKVCIKIAEKLLDYDDVERGPNSEISWVYEVKELVK